MENLIIEKTSSTPYIHFDASTGLLKIQGESFPENAAKFYGPIMMWLNEFLEQMPEEATLEFEVVYFNSSTSKIFMTILDFFEEEYNKGLKVRVNWRCEEDNESAIEFGEDFKDSLDELPFEIILI